jgi:hypothetical protein
MWIDDPRRLLFIQPMSTVLEIKEAIDSLSPKEQAELEALLWAEWDWPLEDESADPPGIREKLAEAAAGRFLPGDPTQVERILKSLE